MKTLLTEHPGLLMALLFFLGWTVHWVIGLLFFRQRYFEQEAQITRQSRELEELRFTQGRTQSELRSKADLLEAVQKSRSTAEAKAAALEADLRAARLHVASLEAQASTQADAARVALNRLAATEEEFARQRSVSPEAAYPEPELKAELLTTRAAANHWANRSDQSEQEAITCRSRTMLLERTLAATQSVNTSLQSAIGARETTILALRSELAQRETERAAVSTALATSDAELARLRQLLASTKAELDQSVRSRASIDVVLRDRETHAAELERKAQELQEAFNEAARECHRQKDEIHRLTTLQASTAASLRTLENEKAEANARATQSQSDTAAIRAAAALVESHSRTQAQELAATHAESSRLQAALAESEKQRAAGLTAIDARESKIAEFRTRLDRLEKELSSSNAAKAAADELVATRDAELRDSRRRLAHLESAIEEAGRARAASDSEAGEDARQLREEVRRLREQAASNEATLATAQEAQAQYEKELAFREDELSNLRDKARSLEEELENVTRANASLNEQLQSRAESAPAPSPSPSASTDNRELEAVLADLDSVSRERNELAAELAALRSATPPATQKPVRKRPEPEPDSTGEPPEEFTARCPQHLSDVKGIGAVFETRLYAAGIGSYWELSRLPAGRLADILELSDTQREQFPFESALADAGRLARETKSVGRRWSQDPPDDLEPITGIGHAFEKKLYDAGICTFDALAASTVEQLAEICPGSPHKKPDHAAWIEQARQLASARESQP